MSNRCPVCAGMGKVLAFGVSQDPMAVICPECAGLAITPASAEDLRAYTVGEITRMLLRPALPAPPADPADPAMDLPEASSH